MGKSSIEKSQMLVKEDYSWIQFHQRNHIIPAIMCICIYVMLSRRGSRAHSVMRQGTVWIVYIGRY